MSIIEYYHHESTSLHYCHFLSLPFFKEKKLGRPPILAPVVNSHNSDNEAPIAPKRRQLRSDKNRECPNKKRSELKPMDSDVENKGMFLNNYDVLNSILIVLFVFHDIPENKCIYCNTTQLKIDS